MYALQSDQYHSIFLRQVRSKDALQIGYIAALSNRLHTFLTTQNNSYPMREWHVEHMQKTIYAQDLIPVVIQKARLFFYVDFQRNPSAFENSFVFH